MLLFIRILSIKYFFVTILAFSEINVNVNAPIKPPNEITDTTTVRFDVDVVLYVSIF